MPNPYTETQFVVTPGKMTVIERAYAYLVGTPLDTPNKIVLDTSAVATAWGAVMGWLPALASLFSILWLGLQMYSWFEKRHQERKARREAERRSTHP